MKPRNKIRDKLRRKQQLAEAAPAQPAYTIPTPAPGDFDRRVPASDVEEERFNRSTFYDTAAEEAAAKAKLRMQNVWERERDLLTERVLQERRFLAHLERLLRQGKAAAEQHELLSDRAREASDEAAGELHQQATVAHRVAHALEVRAAEMEAKANELTVLLDLTARRVHDQAAIVIGHFWHEHAQHARANTELTGEWRTQPEQREAGQLAFAALFGEVAIPSEAEITALVEGTRARVARTSLGLRPATQPAS